MPVDNKLSLQHEARRENKSQNVYDEKFSAVTSYALCLRVYYFG